MPDNGRVLEMTREDFEELVAEALDRIPPELTRLMDNVAVFVEDEPAGRRPGAARPLRGHAADGARRVVRGRAAGPDHDLPGADAAHGARRAASEVVAEVEVTVVHEIAHHFGIDDERLHALGATA